MVVLAGYLWLMSVILATQEAEIRTAVENQPGQTVLETLSQKNPKQRWWSGSSDRVPA
jgi:hypothetical protein